MAIIYTKHALVVSEEGEDKVIITVHWLAKKRVKK